jgi:hypothetical protein
MDQLNPYLSMFLQEFLKIVLPVLAVALAGLVVQGIRWLEAKIKEARPDIYETLAWLADAAVKSAEQAKVAGLVEDKKNYAVDFVQRRLATYGINLDVKEIEAEVEKAVLELGQTK